MGKSYWRSAKKIETLMTLFMLSQFLTRYLQFEFNKCRYCLLVHTEGISLSSILNMTGLGNSLKSLAGYLAHSNQCIFSESQHPVHLALHDFGVT